MPELPDIELYLSALNRFVRGKCISSIHVRSPFVVRTFEPDIQQCVGKQVQSFERVGKRIIWTLADGRCLVFHLMIAGRFHWRSRLALPKAKNDLVAFQFDSETLLMTEASQKKRASIHVLNSSAEIYDHRPPGIEVFEMTFDEFNHQIGLTNHTLKRCLTDPKLFSGIGNAYSDEILHAAKLPPIKWTSKLTPEERRRLFDSIKSTLESWRHKLIEQTGNRFPEKVTAFRPEMAVHGKFGQPCPECSTEVQRIRYADRETNYCPRCQTGGKLLADRSLSRLLKGDWPKTIEELEEQ